MPEQLLVIAYHLIWTAYGTWLPNDPRGGGSAGISCRLIRELGELHLGRKRIQPTRYELRRFIEQAADSLRYPILRFDENARATVANAFQRVVDREKLTCYACCIMPDHVHMIIRKHRLGYEEMMDFLREESRNRLIEAKFCDDDHPLWSAGWGWGVFLDHPDDVRRTIPYVENNSLPLKLPIQRWPFVKPYDGWPLHPGHSPNSPYVKRMRAAGQL